MTRWILFLCVLYTGLISAYAQEYFLQGNQLYQKGEYELALALYKKIERPGTAVWYNMGNCAYHLNDYARALAYWLIAYKEANKSERAIIDTQLQLLEKEGISIGVHRLLIVRMTKAFSPIQLQIFMLIVWYLFLLVMLFKIYVWRRMACMILLSALLITSASLLIGKYLLTRPQAVIIGSSVSLRAGPNEAFHEIDSVKYASILSLKQQNNDWSKVACNRHVGWVKTEELIII